MESVSAPGNNDEENESTPTDLAKIDVAVENDDNNNDVESVEEALEVLRLKENCSVQEAGSNEDVGQNEPDINNGDDGIRSVDVDDDGNDNTYNKNVDCSSGVEEPYASQEFVELSSHKEASVEKDGEDEEFLEPEKGGADEGGEIKEFSELSERLEEEISEQEENEIEAASSPSSSGYAGGRGSSSPASVGSGSGTDEIEVGEETGFYNNGNGPNPMKAASKRNMNEVRKSDNYRLINDFVPIVNFPDL